MKLQSNPKICPLADQQNEDIVGNEPRDRQPMFLSLALPARYRSDRIQQTDKHAAFRLARAGLVLYYYG